jgi:hypothetical protein
MHSTFQPSGYKSKPIEQSFGQLPQGNRHRSLLQYHTIHGSTDTLSEIVAQCSQVNQTLSPGAPSLQSRMSRKGATQGGHYDQVRKLERGVSRRSCFWQKNWGHLSRPALAARKLLTAFAFGQTAWANL